MKDKFHKNSRLMCTGKPKDTAKSWETEGKSENIYANNEYQRQGDSGFQRKSYGGGGGYPHRHHNRKTICRQGQRSVGSQYRAV